MKLDKWYYINLISMISDEYGDKLINMLGQYNKYGLREITYQEAKEYWNLIKDDKRAILYGSLFCYIKE